jgi:hypothetical protein
MPTKTLTPEQWHAELDSAYQREKNWRKDALGYVQLFEAGKRTENQYNILYANTEVLAPAVYNSTPRPVVQRRFKDEDPMGKLASTAVQRVLEYMVDDGRPDESAFDDLLKSAVQEALVPGRGVTRFRYEAEIVGKQDVLPDGDLDNDESEEGGETAPESQEPAESVQSEYVCGEEVPWDRFRHGYAKKWKDVPWVSFEHDYTREELKADFPPEIVAQLPEITAGAGEDEDSEFTEGDGPASERKGAKIVKVFEIWDKSSETVIFISPLVKDLVLKSVPDPLKLSGFFPCPRPLVFLDKMSSLVPVAPYSLYEEQAKELNRITTRINRLLSMLKVRGFYDGTLQGIEQVLKGEDGDLVPVENAAAMQQGQTLDKAIWLIPIDKIITVLQQLYTARPLIKSVIFEISGIADVMRGSSAASETLGAQKIKESWGTLRLKRAQKAVARYARDCLRIMAELGIRHFSQETLQGMTGLPYPTDGQKQQIQATLQQAVMYGDQQQAAQLAQQAQQPSWGQVLALLGDDIQRSYRIDIETNSTVDAEATEDKENIAELLNAISQFLNGVGPLIQEGMMPFEIAKNMLLAIVRRFRFGPDLEDQLKQMQAPQPKPDPKVEAAQMKGQQDAQKHQLDMQAMQAKMAFEQQKMQMELELEREKLAMERQSLQNKMAMQQQQHQQRMQQMAMQAAMPKPQPSGNPNPGN